VETVGRMYLKQEETLRLMEGVNRALDRRHPCTRRNWSKKCRLRSVIREEALKLAQYVREAGDDKEFEFYRLRI